jgi:hypothetical protein
MCVDCVLALLRITQVDPGDEPPSRGGSVTVCFLYDLSNGMTLTQQIVASPVFLITKILVIEDNELHGTFLHVTFRSQSRLRTTSDLICSNTN